MWGKGEEPACRLPFVVYRAVIMGHMLDDPLKLQVNLPVLNKIHPGSTKFVTAEKTKTMGDSQLNDSPNACSKHMNQQLINIEKRLSK